MKKFEVLYIKSYKERRFYLFLIVQICLCFALPACKKFVEVSPPVTSITSADVYGSNTSAASVLTGIYSNITSSAVLGGGPASIGYLCGVAADELKDYSSGTPDAVFYTNSYTPLTDPFWIFLYNQIYVCNAAIEGLTNSSTISLAMKNQLLGEAKFCRAFLHFYATNLYGDVPLATSTNYEVNNVIHRSPQLLVYQQIIADLQAAQSLLNNNFVDPTGATTTDRIRPNKGAATSLLARVYLYQQKWDSAELEASSVISNRTLYSLDTLNGVFLKNSTEAIWQMPGVYIGYNTVDAIYYILTSPPGTGYFNVAISPQLIASFEAGDGRFSNWLETFTDPTSSQVYYYPYKYKVGNYDPSNTVTEYMMVLRLGEQYLIRAEARAEQGNLPGAIEDLDTIRTRAGLGITTATTEADLLKAIYHERQVELFTEWGHRWFDLKRTDSVNSVMTVVTPQKDGNWASYKALLPIPFSEIQVNMNLTQNPGYN
jgi:starch-binding outer membrane protein, SusD/RagB family